MKPFCWCFDIMYIPPLTSWPAGTSPEAAISAIVVRNCLLVYIGPLLDCHNGNELCRADGWQPVTSPRPFVLHLLWRPPTTRGLAARCRTYPFLRDLCGNRTRHFIWRYSAPGTKSLRGKAGAASWREGRRRARGVKK